MTDQEAAFLSNTRADYVQSQRLYIHLEPLLQYRHSQLSPRRTQDGPTSIRLSQHCTLRVCKIEQQSLIASIGQL
ncbi:hypothetical protein BDV38DRAFT_241226 [Aspergillus pseudotamarii]|uniref:Uncharacterized protein n=1 Tax=Aspergillus pseudotamarii TaxID=132259 RepID=A0A5N6T190_ASPPS|nr:uncharacterized protein BDV38DRAFT_241226 [Aspergillus pseudotamarii]KAE8139803.1 hypothetical protein BDV38DRAFT_241226 [Aspergillus pseudotamarii]